MGGGADAGQIFRMSRSTKNHPRAGLLPVGSLLETVGSLSVDRWTRQVSYYGWMRRLLLPLDVGIELWVDLHTPDFAAREALAHRIGEDADASCLGYFMNRTLLQDACSQPVVSRRSSYDWAMPTKLPKSGPTIHCKRTLPTTTCSGHRGSANTRAARRS